VGCLTALLTDFRISLEGTQVKRFGPFDILLPEYLHQLVGRYLRPFLIRHPVDDLADIRMHRLGQLIAEIAFEHVSDASLAGLAVNPDDGIIPASDILRIDREVGDVPGGILSAFFRVMLEALVDGILMGPGKGGKNQIATVGDGAHEPASGCSARRFP
jgi:hypothetical protein